MRTIGEMAVTTMIHANLPKRAWGYATMHAIDVINRTASVADKSGFSRLEKWKGHQLPGQTKGLYPFGCLAFKHIPAAIRPSKLDQHATPCVYLGIDAKSRSYLLGSLYELHTSVGVEDSSKLCFPSESSRTRSRPPRCCGGTESTIVGRQCPNINVDNPMSHSNAGSSLAHSMDHRLPTDFLSPFSLFFFLGKSLFSFFIFLCWSLWWR